MADARLVIEIEDASVGDSQPSPASSAVTPATSPDPSAPAGSLPPARMPEPSTPPGTASHWDTLPEWKPAGEELKGEPAGSFPVPAPTPALAGRDDQTERGPASTTPERAGGASLLPLPPVAERDPLREAIEQRQAERDRMTAANLARREAERDRREKERAERALARDAENEARRVAREEIREREATAKKLAADSEKQRLENERFAKRVAEENKAWEEARQRARAVVAKQREAEEPVKAVAESRRQRDEAESRTQRRADTIAKWSNRAGDAAQYLGRAAGGMAGNDARPALVGAVDAATAGLSRLGPYGMAAGQALQAVAKVGTAASETVDAFVKRGRELSSYNGQLAGASATADLRSMMADIREANDLGPQMSQLIEQQSKNDAVMREIMLPIKSFLIDEVKDFMTGLMVVASSGLEGFNELLDTFHVKSDAIEKALGKIKDVLADRDLDGDPMRIWRDAAARMEFAPPAPVPGGGPLGVPLIVRKP